MDVLRRSWAPVQFGLVIMMTGLLTLPLAAVAHAAEPGGSPTLCTMDFHDTASPGWLMTPSHGTAYQVGTITCVGALDGKQLTGGPGHFESWYSYGPSDMSVGGNTCALAAGSGTWQATLPTVNGSALALTGPWGWTGNMAGELHGQLGSHPVEMAWEAHPEQDHLGEDCITEPASHFRVLAQGPVG